MVPYEMIGRNIMVVDKYFRLYLKDALKIHDMNTAEGLALLVLLGKQGVGQDYLIDELQYDKGVIARTMKALEEKGLVEKMKNDSDLRAANYFLTLKSLQFKPIFIDLLKSWNDRILSGVSEEELEVVNKVLILMAENSVRRGE